MKWLQLVYILKSNETRIAQVIHNLRSNRSTELNKWVWGGKNTRLDADITLVAYPNAFRVKGMEKYAS